MFQTLQLLIGIIKKKQGVLEDCSKVDLCYSWELWSKISRLNFTQLNELLQFRVTSNRWRQRGIVPKVQLQGESDNQCFNNVYFLLVSVFPQKQFYKILAKWPCLTADSETA